MEQSASQRITQLLATCSESQRAYLSALAAFRNSLKDVLEKESSLRTVVRDREILVGRLIKLGNKKPGDSAYESHALKLDDAQQELDACESGSFTISLVCNETLSSFCDFLLPIFRVLTGRRSSVERSQTENISGIIGHANEKYGGNGDGNGGKCKGSYRFINSISRGRLR